ncbi:MAG: N-6 DNA methylase, partial [Candidatus Micrarchaeia archaeon]
MVDEPTIVSNLKSYVDELKDEGFEAEVEIHPSKTKKRVDLIIYYNKKILINIEYKKPTVIEGRNPRATDLVMDAHFKANNFNPPSRFFGTSNFNETIIWDNSDMTRPILSRDIEIVRLPIEIASDDDFNKDNVKQALRLYIQQLVYRVRDLLAEKGRIHYKPLGESFIEGLNAHLNLASEACIKYVPINILKKWWREQHYDPVTEFGDEEKKRIAKYSLYVLANKIMFYYVLKRSFNLPEMNILDNGKIKDLENLILKNFNEAKKQSGNYETVFEDSDADKIPFLNDECFYPVSTLIKFFKEYNFSALSQDILGNIYDRLIAPDERHAFGQYYTPIPVVDLINALTIKSSDARVLDPACGSGTFLTRAFDLKLKLNGQDNEDVRKKFLSELFGVEIASYPAHLATIALASKLLVYNPDIYPNIIKDDFLNIQTKMVIPRWKFAPNINHKTTDLKGMEKEVIFKPIDAVVSNLPYIRQENIDNKDSEQNKVENFLYQNGFSKDRPNNTSDFHVYFWYYILPFLKEGSRVGFLTSDTWLNVEYGNDLKKFINKYFKIIAIIDSSVERWFEDALVNTVITVLERTDDKEKRKNNKIKFVRIHRKISELIKDLDDALKIAENIENGISSDYIEIMREVRQ